MAVSAKITITQNSQNIANNTSNVTVKCIVTTSGASYNMYEKPGTCTIDGKTYDFEHNIPSNSATTVYSRTMNISHKADGTKTLSASFKYETGISAGTVSASTSKKLTTIPRTSKVSLSKTNFNIGETITINTNRASSSFTHTIVIKFNGKTVRTQNNVGANYSWNTNELYKYIPNANKATGTVTLTTYSGSTKIGTSTVNFTANVVNSNPNFSNFDVEDINEVTLSLTGNSNKYIKKYSNAKVTITAANKMTTKNSATPNSYNVVAGDANQVVNYSDTASVEATINNINSNTISVYAIDSRNNQTGVTKSLDIIEYTEVLLQSINIERENGVGTNVLITANGKYSAIDFGQVINILDTIEIRKKSTSSTEWEKWISIKNLFTINNEDGSFYTTSKLIETMTFDLGVEYDIQVRVKDKLSEDIEDFKLNSGELLMSALKDKGICFGGIYDEEVGGSIQISTASGAKKILGFVITEEIEE